MGRLVAEATSPNWFGGTAVAVDDPHKVAEVWNEAWKVRFPGGNDDPSLVLRKVHADRGEYCGITAG